MSYFPKAITQIPGKTAKLTNYYNPHISNANALSIIITPIFSIDTQFL